MRPTEQSRVVLSISPEMRAIYDAHFALVWRYMAQRGVQPTQIDDLVHRVFRVVREHPGRREANLQPAVLACMVARQVLREFQRNGYALEPRSSDSDGPTSIFERGAAQELLQSGLETLLEVEREVYLLCEGERLSMEEVADALGLLESNVQRKRARANKQMNEFIAKLRKAGVWRPSSAPHDHDLLEAAQAACTPTDRDRDRVFAAMIAHSMTRPLEFAPTESIVLPKRRSMLPPPPAVDARPERVEPEAAPRLLAQTWPPRYARMHKGWLWGTASAVAMTFTLASYFLGSTNASEGPTPAPVVVKMSDAVPVRQKQDPRPAAAAPKKVAQTAALAEAPKASAPKAPSAAEGQPNAARKAPAAPERQPNAARKVPAAPERQRAPVASVGEKPRPTAAAAVRPAPSKELRAEAAQAADKRGAETAARQIKRAQAAEAKLLFAAERNYRGGAQDLALEMVANHQRRYPDSALAIERDVLRAQLLCSKGRHREARRIVAELEALEASPSVLDSVERGCAKDAP